MAQINKAGLGIFGLKKIVYGLLIFAMILGLCDVVAAAPTCGCVGATQTFVSAEKP
ncbi:MAG: hypothetical protein KAT65_20535 [Methanophagales archaeon]|nr:hypothetical protein [Methanophagales archaeon]